MSQTTGHLYTAIDAPESGYLSWERKGAGTVAIGGGSSIPGPIYGTDYGVSIGPLHVATEADASVVVDDIDFRAEPDSILEELFGASIVGGMVAGSAGENRVTRRGVLAVVGAALGAAAISGSARGESSQLKAVTVASMDVRDATGNVEIRLTPTVDAVLSTDYTYDVVADGSVVGTLETDDPVAVIPQDEVSGETIEVTRDGGIMADLRGFLADDQLIYELEIPELSDLAAGSELVLSRDRLLTEPVRHAAPDRTQFVIGETSVPHAEEDRDHPVGSYYIDGEEGVYRFMYRVGEDAPLSREATLSVRGGFLAEMTDDQDWLFDV